MLDCSWQLPPNQLLANKNEVHIWRSTLDLPGEKVEILAQTLSANEHKRAQKFHFEQDRQRFIVARGLLRTILGSYLAVPAASLEFDYGQYGKPEIRETQIKFNLSHSKNLALYAITSDRNLGIDLEFIRPMKEAEQIAKRYFSPQENAIFQALSPNAKPVGFFHYWTRLEAYLKAVGDGLAAGNDNFDKTVATKKSRAKGWFLHSFTPAANYIATVAVEGSDWKILYLKPSILL